ncbi:hypothetical protein AB35_3630 [Escherichia coli 2-474-04_S1_C2]|nr:hypothetical protein AB35_3630 [Escherichia coli 2-474-04_S1_C2]
MVTGKMDAKVCRHFAATTKEKGATLSRNPLIYLVGWRSLNNSRKYLLIGGFNQFNFLRYT